MVLEKNWGWIHTSLWHDLDIYGRMALSPWPVFSSSLSFLGGDPWGVREGTKTCPRAMLAGGRLVCVACCVIWPTAGSVKGLPVVEVRAELPGGSLVEPMDRKDKGRTEVECPGPSGGGRTEARERRCPYCLLELGMDLEK